MTYSDLCSLIVRCRSAIPRGRLLPEHVWRQRHRIILLILQVQAAGLFCFALLAGHGLLSGAAGGILVSGLALLSVPDKVSRLSRAVLASASAFASSALLVHYSGGYIEMHFHFFVTLALIALYQDWVPFLMNLGLVVLHHGITGVLSPTSVYNHAAAIAHPWTWALIHGLFVLAESAAILTYWRLNESANHELLETEQQLRLVIESAPNGMLMVNGDGVITLVNVQVEQCFGYRRQELLGQPLECLLPERHRGGHQSHRTAFFKAPTVREMGARPDLFGRRKDGTEFPVEIKLSPVQTSAGLQVLASLVDVTERKRAQAELQRAKVRAERAVRDKAAIFSAVQAFFISIDEGDKVTEWTPAAEALFGISLCDAIDRPLGELPIGWNWDDLRIHIEQCRDTLRSVSLDRVHTRKASGESRFVRVAINAVLSDTSVGVVLMGEDVTDRLRLEQELAQGQKLESIGQLAAGIAHEINTPTQFVGDNTRFLNDSFAQLREIVGRYREMLAALRSGPVSAEWLRGLEEAEQAADLEYLLEEVPKAIAQSIEGIDRIAHIVKAMKEFAHPDTGEKAAVELNKAIESTITVACNEWKYVAEVVTDFDLTLPPVLCLPGEINQVILNLIVNAAHAVAEVVGKGSGLKGTITVSTRRAGEWAEIRIRDTGTGIPEGIRERIFDPFFTTKEVGKGTGQGLSIARTVVTEKHGGSLTFETAVGEGTTFIIRLPIGPLTAEPAGLQPSHPASDRTTVIKER